MLDAGLDTFVEENSYWRSLCHAWSAHPAIEFLERVLGITARVPGFAEVDVRPHVCGLQHARGRVCTPRGPLSVAWRVDGSRFHLEIESPAATAVHVTLPDGNRAQSAGGKFSTSVLLP
jgi:hypothetical protein